MKIKIIQIQPNEWKQFAENAHLVVFGEKKIVGIDRIDFTLVAEDPRGVPMGYITCKEFDARSLYWQFGGAFPGTKKTSMSFRMYQEALRWCEKRYDRISTVVENKNYAMLKMHLISGFLIIGFRVFSGQGLVELTKEFRSELGT